MSHKLWGGRFTAKTTNELADQFTFSISYDQKLALYDCVGSIAHAKMLGESGIIPKKDSAAIVKGLNQLIKSIKDGSFKYDPKAEDIHTDIQQKLKKLIGAPADKLHTARSRNDQVVCDVKLYCKDQGQVIVDLIKQLQLAIVKFADKNDDVIIPAYTHLQSAQVVLLAHHMLAYVEMLERDQSRFCDAIKRLDVNPLGSCALSGTTLKTDRDFVTKQLGFASTSTNSMDSVSDRDFIVELLADISIVGMHLSRMCEDLIIWATQEFDYIDIAEEFCTGSSIMPHKKNPDVLELIRGTASKFPGQLMEVLVLMKALPLTYNRDMQMDKPALFDAVETTQNMLALMTQLFGGLKPKRDVLKARVADESFFTVDVMDYLVNKGVSYREAHDTLGAMVKGCLDKKQKISDMDLNELKKYSKHFELDAKKLLNAKASVEGKRSTGSTKPALVKKEIARWKRALKR